MTPASTTPATPPSATRPAVHKFGGAALADAAALRHAAATLAAWRAGPATDGASDGARAPAVVVASAMRGVTDALLDIARRAAAGDVEAARRLGGDLHAQHATAARDLAPGDAGLAAMVDDSFAELTRIVDGLAALGELTPATTDAVVARGERLSARLFVVALAAAGVDAEYVDAAEVVQTDGRAGNAFPDPARTPEAARRVLTPLLGRGVVPVVPGFLGAPPRRRVVEGAPPAPAERAGRGPIVVTLGRGGSDLTATALARALGAPEVVLWKDVPGLLTADPRVVPEARVIPELDAREASELAYHGAKVLHPRALIPLTAPPTRGGGARAPAARLVIRPFADPTGTGTTITVDRTRQASRKARGRNAAARAAARLPVKAVSAIGAQALVTLRGTGMAGVPGIAARAFAALERAGVSVSLISQASSEQTICLGVPGTAGATAAAVLNEAFAVEERRGEIEGVDVRPDVATVAIVGSGMAGVPGVAARLFGALADAGINIVAIAQGSSELNISVVVDAADAAGAQRAAHAAFRLDRIGGGAAQAPPHADVVLLGFGRVGRELARQLARQLGRSANGGGSAPVQVVGVVDSRGYVFDPAGIAPRRLLSLVREKERGRGLGEVSGGRTATAAEAVEAIAAHALSRPVLVDVTAGDTTRLLTAAVGHGMDLVLANKRPLAEAAAAAHPTADGVLATAAARGRRVLHEATVGAGLPIMDTVRKLHESGDEVLRIEGCPSGTLGFLFAELGRGRAFSEALRDAMARGYTEPDPRDDLGGQDVARKAVILGRLIGWRGGVDDVEVESLVPAALRDVPLTEFLDRLEELDAPWRERVEAAAARGAALRYRADVTPRSVSVGIAEVGASSPFAALRGTDNQFAFTTRRYRDRPLVITGPGAGPAVTAAGVLNDVLALAGAR